MSRTACCLAAFLLLTSPSLLSAEAPLDFDGDGRSDLAVYRNGTWWIQRSTAGISVIAFGIGSDIPVPADYDGDGSTDRAIWRNGVFWVSGSMAGVSTRSWGQAGDDPRVVGDYDGDGDADLAVYRPGASVGQPGFFWVRRSTDGGTNIVQWGVNGDVALPGNFVGSSRADYCVYRPSNSTFYVLDGQTSAFTSFALGDSSVDRVVAMNRVGSSLIDFAVFRNAGPDAGDWYSQSPLGASLYEPDYGLAGDMPVPFVETVGANSSLVLVRPESGQLRWYRRQNPEGTFFNIPFGLATDVVPGFTFFVR